MTYHPHHVRFYKKGRALYLKMLVVEENPLIMNFFEEHGLRLPPNEEKAVKAFVHGLLVDEGASVKHVAENTVRGQSERQMNRSLHRLSARRARDMLLYNLRSLQTITSLAIRPKGVIALDEHVIPKTGKEIEGVDYFYSTAHNKEILGLSMITTHYYGGPFEYPLDCLLYRRPQELEKRHHSERYVPKNEALEFTGLFLRVQNKTQLGGHVSAEALEGGRVVRGYCRIRI